MRRRTLNLLPAVLVCFVVSGIAGILALRGLRETPPEPGRRVQLLGLDLDVPATASRPVHKPGEPWTAEEFRGAGLGSVRLARERPQGGLQEALRAWFDLPGPLDGPARVPGRSMEVRPVTVFGPGAYAVRREGKVLVAVCVFEADGSRYWLQTQVSGTAHAPLAAFDRLLLSLRRADGAGVEPALQPALAALEKEYPGRAALGC